jgi:hypothetical protein
MTMDTASHRLSALLAAKKLAREGRLTMENASSFGVVIEEGKHADRPCFTIAEATEIEQRQASVTRAVRGGNEPDD